jgi:hypothetical protein
MHCIYNTKFMYTSFTNYKLVKFAFLYCQAAASKSTDICNMNRNTLRGKQQFNHRGQTLNQEQKKQFSTVCNDN